MTPYEINQLAGYIALAAVIPVTVITLVFGLGSPWYRSWLGRVVFAQWLALELVFGVVLARRFLGAYPGYEWVAVISYSTLLLAFAAMAVIVIIERRAPRSSPTNQKG